ncbi:MAG: response regulator [Thermodesulfobacteriota bacterium]|nr:response regulator [Thermodesulfobacteriota bacterium]
MENSMEEKANILIVDDELGPRESLKMILKPFFNIFIAEDGQSALSFLREETINLVTLDLNMPGISGIEVLKAIKRYSSDIEVIIITGYGSQNTAIDALRCGALDYISKPYEIKQVKEVVEKGIKKYRANIRKRSLEEQLIYAEKKAALGQLAPKIAHEINNPLQVIYGKGQQGLMKSKKGDIFNGYFKGILTGAERIDRISQQLMNYSKPFKDKRSMIDINSSLNESLNLLKDFGEIKKCDIQTCYYEAIPLIKADKFQLEQVFINLIINSSHAMEAQEVKRLTVETSLCSDESHIEIKISDTGCGIAEEDIDKVFLPFFTTKEKEKGNGLGLSIVKMIVDKHRGDIYLTSKPGKGTVFKIILPRVMDCED